MKTLVKKQSEKQAKKLEVKQLNRSEQKAVKGGGMWPGLGW